MVSLPEIVLEGTGWPALGTGPEQGLLQASYHLMWAEPPPLPPAFHRQQCPPAPGLDGRLPLTVIHLKELEDITYFQRKRQLLNFHHLHRCRFRSRGVLLSDSPSPSPRGAESERGSLVSFTFSGQLSKWINHSGKRGMMFLSWSLKINNSMCH